MSTFQMNVNKNCSVLFLNNISMYVYICLSGLTWTQCEDTFTLHALPTTHCSNLIEASHAGIYHTDIGAFDFHTSGIEDLGGEDFDYAMDCGDFIF